MPGALVIAGGGLAGIAWELGFLRGLADASPATARVLLHTDTTLIGTSAGSAVAAQLSTGRELDAAYEAQLREESAEIGAEIDRDDLQALVAAAVEGASSPEEARRRIGALALEATTLTEQARRAVIAARVADADWPQEQRLLITAVDTATGELRVFDRTSGVELVDAIAASCAVPGVWPPVTIDGMRYMDGGVRSGSNADLAVGADWVLIVSPQPGIGIPGAGLIPTEELDALSASRVEVVYADDVSIAAFGRNPLDPAVCAGSARAGRAQGARLAPRVMDLLGI
ncbi:patatin-like phospholipase family protein [Rathayibacter toxicus]|uniref:patatin-like phospholipase family protein n=1 Tax=Rathayibacter toxicus TaxID=145458 RepID=UPI001C05D8CD|nr:patatin-like phospholipase family protein [Rathayibacter toxicus]QWL32473.1 patatin-like phospholipase family protein [Rathayibacter toxicus]QWL34567.1 patatin-like phospholipase family protein [Rathayibacter toxicus]QWL36699.1 patatin-like phospholipase family protein [Rathayibacter toxicus]QWL38788.1 patatin-like phospholipase family protein [Rathayibacter toxicus]QWL40876.1 patatin-like phospholipase family protein [Rathayibacter toxicus]